VRHVEIKSVVVLVLFKRKNGTIVECHSLERFQLLVFYDV